MASKAYERYIAALNTGEVGESFIRGVKMALNASDRRKKGYSVGSTAPSLTAEEAERLLDAIAADPPRINAKQSAKGLAWLRSRAIQRALGIRARDIVANFDHFTLCDMLDAGQTRVAFYVPVYCVHAKDGRVYVDKMIAHRVMCGKEQCDQLLALAFKYFADQRAIFVTEIGVGRIVNRENAA